jgi:anthranilate phosphoribosyltransferase
MGSKKRSHELTSESFERLLTHLAHSPETYTPEELSESLDHLFNPDSCTEYQIGAFLALLRASGLEGRPDMISTAAQDMRERAVRVELETDGWADLVGTGGDGKDTFNVSTTAALVAAGAGVKICKVSIHNVQASHACTNILCAYCVTGEHEACHIFEPPIYLTCHSSSTVPLQHGARASSSASGSADVLLALGIPITSLPLSRIPSIASTLEYPFLFLFAPVCHPALGLVAPIRRQLGHPTIFNILGPLLNPARPDYMIVGVHSHYLGRPFAEALKRLKVKRAWVVNGDEGLDEISPEGTSHVSCDGFSWSRMKTALLLRRALADFYSLLHTDMGTRRWHHYRTNSLTGNVRATIKHAFKCSRGETARECSTHLRLATRQARSSEITS